MLGLFAAVHALYIALGVRFDTTPLSWFWQYLDVTLLRGRLAESLLYLHCQPPLFNLFLGIFFSTLGFACLEPFLFVGYLISIALFGLYQAIFMANAGGAWDNAKKIVETELKMKGTELHAASVVGDTVGDPFKDTSSVAMNPVIKFTTLFGLLAVELGVYLSAGGNGPLAKGLAVAFFVVSLVFVHRSFYGMRIETQEVAAGAHRPVAVKA